MTPVEWLGIALVTAALVLFLIAWGFWRPLGLLWTIWFMIEAATVGALGGIVAMGRFPRPENQTIVVGLLFLGVAAWHLVLIATTPLHRE